MKAQWLSAGLEALRKGGVGSVRVERLAGDVGITKGSFYHHFRDRGALLDAVIEYWSREMTDAEFERIQTLRGGLAARLVALAEDVLEKGMGRYAPAVRASTGVKPPSSKNPASALMRRRSTCATAAATLRSARAQARIAGS